MTTDTEERVIRLEDRVETHDGRIDKLELRVGTIHTDLNKLISLTSNIRWWLAGVGTFYIVQEIGIIVFIKKLVGV